MKYTKTQNIHAMTSKQIASLPIGQWVCTTSDTTDKTSKGIFLGVKPSGTVVVAWYMNAKGQKSFRQYVQTLRNYARG
jgi:hypothetical protein